MFDRIYNFYLNLIETPSNLYKIGFWNYSNIMYYKLNYFKDILYFVDILGKIKFKTIKTTFSNTFYFLYQFKFFFKILILIIVVCLI
jgi:hypothetical protein